ncbi:MAG TPA: DUF1565 domain-containing protein [Tetrasphaera sp.]|uniref:DUF1565 domain-containing protein n=1 Tax=Nostocoides sp. TaxID=1917966 RepID=UPI002BEAF5ED|nr:DUF1565 domain-containing protein [Tetrasphaera sp.]HNQ06957.1 DUF1565 domain-containing protein [Tetrasphaera sp.]
MTARNMLASLPVLGMAALALQPAPATAAGTTIDVAVTGKDTNPGTAAAPLKTIQAAINKATPGTTIRVHKGTYSQQLIIRKSGKPGLPITITSAGDGEVIVTSTQPTESCDNRKPSPNRTILIQAGSDYWNLSKLTIVNGVYINGGGAYEVYTWHDDLVDAHVWEPRRKVPGTFKYDPTGAKDAVSYLSKVLGRGLNPSDHIEITGNKMSGRGIHASFARFGAIKDNTITNVACGTGPGVWIITFSNFWEITGNDVSHIADSAGSHFMQEGIRLGTASNYNHVANNYVHDLGDDGRGIATDVDASYNLFENNNVVNAPIGYNDEMSGWGNTWRNNVASNFKILGFGFRMKDAVLKLPSKDTSTWYSIVDGNKAIGGRRGAAGLSIGAIGGSKFTNNSFGYINLGAYVAGYWAKQGNTWNGTTQPPK